MNKKSLSILMRARMRALPAAQLVQPARSLPQAASASADMVDNRGSSSSSDIRRVTLIDVKEWMHASITIPNDKIEAIDANLDEFLKGYLGLSQESRMELLLVLAKDYDVKRARVFDLVRQYLNIELPQSRDVESIGEQSSRALEEDGTLAAFYRMEQNLRDALKPMYGHFFERLNAYPGGLKLLAVLRADLLAVLARENSPSLRALDSYLKEKLITWLSPASLELHQITWDDSASLLEKIVAYEAVHPIRNLLDLKRRLSEGRRCFSYLHPAIPGEPLVFIEVALLKEIASSIQDVLWDSPPTPENEATCALFYSISSTQPGLSGINLGKFLIKRAVNLLRRDMPHVKIFATLSPIPGYMNWLVSKLASQMRLASSATQYPKKLSDEGSSSTLQEDILLPEEEEMILSGYMNWVHSEAVSEITSSSARNKDTKFNSDLGVSSNFNSHILQKEEMINSFREGISGKSAIEIMHEVLISTEWAKSVNLREALRPPLLRLCARYLIKEKKRGKALDSVANFHLQNGAMVERLNWMADQSEKGIEQSGGIMVNYVYRLDQIDENAQSYSSTGNIHASYSLHEYLEKKDAPDSKPGVMEIEDKFTE